MADKDMKTITPDTSPALAQFVFGADSQSATDPNLWTFDNVKKLFAVGDIRLYPLDNEPPSTNYATLDTRNGHPVLDFDTTTGESAIFTALLPRAYNGGGLTVEIAASLTSATSGTLGWLIDFEDVGTAQDTDSDGFTGSPTTVTAATVPGTSGAVLILSANVANGSAMDSIAAGDQFRIKITRDVANDTATGDAELHWVRIKEQ